MTLLELIANCVNFTTQDEEDINPSNLETFRNSTNYRSFLKNALPEINRAIQELAVLKKLPLEVIELDGESLDDVNRFVFTNEQNQKIYRIFKVEVYADNNCYSPVEYRKEGKWFRLPSLFDRNQIKRICIKYYPRPKLLSEADKGIGFDNDNGEDKSLDLNTIGLNDTICTMVIPYLVKSRIWQEVEPEMAQLERNIGLQNASMLVDAEEEVYQSYVARNSWGE